jgi:hypothetical protein
MSAPNQFKIWLDRLLVANVFLVIFAAIWFLAAVGLEARQIHAPLSLFKKLWEPLFTPALGILMAGALINAAWSWWQRRGLHSNRRIES